MLKKNLTYYSKMRKQKHKGSKLTSLFLELLNFIEIVILFTVFNNVSSRILSFVPDNYFVWIYKLAEMVFLGCITAQWYTTQMLFVTLMTSSKRFWS